MLFYFCLAALSGCAIAKNLNVEQGLGVTALKLRKAISRAPAGIQHLHNLSCRILQATSHLIEISKNALFHVLRLLQWYLR